MWGKWTMRNHIDKIQNITILILNFWTDPDQTVPLGAI